MTDTIALPTAEQARALTDRIKVAVEGTWQLIREAYTTRTWAVLGYESWDAYCAEEFPTTHLKLPREERPEAVASLREAGLSIPAIASATGLGVGTVHRALGSAFPNGKVGQPETITGTNGKTYAATRPAPEPNTWVEPQADDYEDDEPEPVIAELVDEPTAPEPAKAKRRPLPEAFTEASRDLTRAAERLHRLTEDDRFTRNRDQTHHQMPELLGALDHATRLVQAMNLPDAQTSEEARRWWAASLNTLSDALRDVANSIEKEL